jgi:hypothetical protein
VTLQHLHPDNARTIHRGDQHHHNTHRRA